MINETIASYRATLQLIGRATSDLGRGQWTAQPSGILNHPAWTIGHLVHSAQAIGCELGLSPWLPDSWAEKFGTGSTPQVDGEVHPGPAELERALVLAEQKVVERLQSMSADVLAGPLPDVRYREVFPSLGHAVVHILCAHTSFHGGQIMLWRRAMGLPTESAL